MQIKGDPLRHRGFSESLLLPSPSSCLFTLPMFDREKEDVFNRARGGDDVRWMSDNL